MPGSAAVEDNWSSCAAHENGDSPGTAGTLRVLGDPLAFRIISALGQCSTEGINERELADIAGLPASEISTQLASLRKAGLVESQRRGTNEYHRTRSERWHALASLLTDATVPATFIPTRASSGRKSRRRGRPRGSHNTRAEIVLAARSLALRVGFDALTMGAVAAAAGVSRAAINYHFTSKAALYRAVLAETHTDIDRAASATAHFLRGEQVSTQLQAFITKLVNPHGDWSAAAALPSLILDCSRHPDLVDDGVDIIGLVRGFLTSSMSAAAAHQGPDEQDGGLAVSVEATLAFILGLGISAQFGGGNTRAQQLLVSWLALVDGADAAQQRPACAP